MSQKYVNKYSRLVWLENGDELDGTVPVNWISEDHKYMFWPSRGNVQHQIKNGTKPNEQWKKFQIKKIMLWNDSYKACNGYEATTTPEISDHLDWPTPPLSKKFRSTSVSHSQNEHPEPSTFKRQAGYDEEPDEDRESDYDDDVLASTSQANINQSFLLAQEKFQKRVLHLLMEIKELLKRSNNPEEVTLVQSTQLEEFYAFDKTLSEKAVRLNVLQQLSRVGGHDADAMVFAMMKRLMSNWVMSQLCVKGKTKNKITFQEMAVFPVLIAAVQNTFKETNENQIRNAMERCLKYAPYRPGGTKCQTVRTTSSSDSNKSM